jgi:hypothetical protein
MTPAALSAGPRRGIVLLQAALLVLLVPAALLGAFGVASVAVPAACGDFSGAAMLPVMLSWAVGGPLGLVALVVGWFARSGSARLRRACIGLALLALALPAVATALATRWHCH